MARGDRLGTVTVGVAADLSALHRGFQEAAAMMQGFAARAQSATGGVLRQALAVASGSLIADGVRHLAGALPNLVRDSVKLAASWEQSAVQFEVMLGSAEKARDLMRDLRQFAAESPLTLTDSANEATKLLAAGVQQQQIVPTLGVLSDLTMGDREKFARLSLAYSQVRSAGRLQGDELRQLQELGIALNEPLAKATGIPVEGLKEAVSGGRVLFTDFQKALKAMTSEGGQFFGMTEKGAQTTAGTFARLEGATEELKREFGRAVIEESGLNDALRDGSRFADDMRAAVDDLRPAIRFGADLAKGVAQITGEALRNAPLFARAFAEAFRTNAPAMSQFFTAVGDFVTRLKDFRMDPHAVIDAAELVATTFGTAFDGMFRDVFGGVKDYWVANIQPLLDDLKSAADTIKAVKDGVKGALRTLEVRDAPEDRLRAMAKESPLALATEAKLKEMTAQLKGFADPLGDAARPLRERYKALNLAYHEATGKEFRALELEKYNSRLDFGVEGPSTFPSTVPRDRTGLRAALPAAEGEVLIARRNLERALAAETRGPVQQFLAGFDKNGLREALAALRGEFAGRRDGRAADPMAAVLGGAAATKDMRARAEFKIDDPARGGGATAKLPEAAELGSRAAAEAYSKFIGGAETENPQVAELKKLVEVQQRALALLGGMATKPDTTPVITLPAR